MAHIEIIVIISLLLHLFWTDIRSWKEKEKKNECETNGTDAAAQCKDMLVATMPAIC